MKKLISWCLAMTLMCSSGVYAANSSVDTSDLQGHWAKDIILDLSSKNIIKGYKDGTFKPDGSITRAEFVSILNRAMNFEGNIKLDFEDVKEGDWFYNDIQPMVANNIVKGYDGKFFPNSNITRAEAAVMVSKVVEETEKPQEYVLFSDDKGIPSWAKSSIYSAAKMNIITGYPDNSFKAKERMTRAEASVIVDRLVKHFIKKEEENLYVSQDNAIVSGKHIKGNLVITSEVGEGTVTLKDMVVDKDLIVLGGGSHSVNLQNVKVKGKLILRKRNVRIHFIKENEIDTLVIEKNANIDSEKSGSKIADIVVDTQEKDSKVTISAKVKNIIVKEKVQLSVNETVGTITVEKGAKDSVIELHNNSSISDIYTKADLEIKGNGKVDKIEKGTNIVKIEKTVQVSTSKNLSSGGSSLGGSSSGSSHKKQNTVKVSAITLVNNEININSEGGKEQLQVTYTPSNADNKELAVRIFQGEDIVSVRQVSNNTLELTALDNGHYEMEVYVKDDPSVIADSKLSGEITGQIVGIQGDTESLQAGDKEITGIVKGGRYVLGVEDKYVAVDSNGLVSSKYDSKDKAKLFAGSIQDGVNKITGLDNKITYTVYKNLDASLKEKVSLYLNVSEDSITPDNVLEIQELEDSLLAQFLQLDDEQARKKAGEEQFKANKEKLHPKIQEVVNKIDHAIHNDVPAQINSIKGLAKGLAQSGTEDAFQNIKYEMDQLDSLLNDIPSKKRREIGEDKLQTIKKIKEEINQYEHFQQVIKEGSFTFDEKGVVSIPRGLDPAFQIRVERTNNDHYLDDTIKAIGTETRFDCLEAVRKDGNDRNSEETYVATLEYSGFVELPKFTSHSNKQTLHFLKLFDPMTLTFSDEGDPKKSGGSDGKVEMDFVNGELKWDSIPNAEYYEIYGRYTERSLDIPMGKYYVKEISQGSDEFFDINTQKSVSEIPFEKGKWPSIAKDTPFTDKNAVRVAYMLKDKPGIKTNSISLSDFIPVNTSDLDNIIKVNGPLVLDIYIVPVNYHGLYITNKSILKDRKTIFIDGDAMKFSLWAKKFKFTKE